ncbi:MAG TPA: PEP-CTERM sorting domain-containing protein, partial [Lacipirellulaceae bacterium]|nr:PEP-CTERM sorting domain-containing protein [Lacipirellulaceae bacterium]
DGFAMRILSEPTGGALTQHAFTSSRNGRLDPDGSLVFLAPTGDSNTQGVINLAPGTYDVEFIWYENAGGAFAEVSTHKGDLIASPLTDRVAQWILLGDGTSLPEQERPFKQPARLTGPVTVKNNVRGTINNVTEIVAHWRGNPTPTHEGMFDEVILNGDGGNGIQGANAGPGNVHQFPNGTGVDQFTTSVTGEFTVLDTNGVAGEVLTFGLFSDDNAGLHILGQSFTGVAGDMDTLGNPEGMTDQWLLGDYRTGNTNAYGLITLQDNTTYDFEAFMLEEGGGAVLEVWVAPGDQLATGFDPTKFFPLTVDVAPTLLSANNGLGLVQGPGTGPSGGTAIPGDYNNDGKVDAGDYVVWRKTNINGQAGYDTWRMNFGRTSGSGSALSAVPEPAAGLLVILGLVGGALVSRRRAN